MTWLRRILILGVCLSAVGCLKTRSQLQSERTDAQIRKGPPAPPKPPPAALKFDEYDAQFRDLTGRMEVVERRWQEADAQAEAEKEARAQERKAMENKLLAYEEELKKLEQQIESLNQEVARLKAGGGKSSGSRSSGKSTKNSFQQAEDLFNGKKWKDAIIAYQRYRDGNPKGKFYAEATYKIGVCFQELGMKSEAKAFFEEVTAKFGSSKEAKKARIRLKSLK